MEQKTTPQLICHYTKLESGLNILFEKKLRLNKISKTNDPRESRPLEFLTFQDYAQLDNPEVKMANELILNELPKTIMEEWKVLCFTLDASKQSEYTDERISKLYAAFIDPGYARPRMWAQYADNHKGVCLLFDKDEIGKKIQQKFNGKCFPGKVGYDGETFVSLSLFLPPATSTSLINDIKNLGAKEAARKYVFEHSAALFLRKNPDWEHETEYRWLIHSTINEVEDVSIEGAVKAVLVGMDFQKIYVPSLIPLCKDLGIPAKRILWKNGIPKTEFETIYEPER